MFSLLYVLTEGLPDGIRLAAVFGPAWLAVLGTARALLPLPLWLEARMSRISRSLVGRPLPAVVGELCEGLTVWAPPLRKATGSVTIALLLLVAVSLASRLDPSLSWAVRVDVWSAGTHQALMED